MDKATQDGVAERVRALVANSKGLPLEQVTPASSFEELGIDSLDKVNLSFAVEEAFAIEIPDDALGNLRTVGDVIAGVERLLAAKQA